MECSCPCESCVNAGVRYTETAIDPANRCLVGFALCARCGEVLERIEIGRHDVAKYAAYLKVASGAKSEL